MGLDFNDTCPYINDSINKIKTQLESIIDDMLNEYSSDFSYGERNDFVSKYLDYMYDEISDIFENVRNTNVDMRQEADYQIDNLLDDIYNLNMQIENLRYEIIDLKNEISALQCRVVSY